MDLMLVCYCACSFYLLIIPFYFFYCFYQKKFGLRLFLYCSYFSSDFSLDVLIKFVLNKKKSVIVQYVTLEVLTQTFMT